MLGSDELSGSCFAGSGVAAVSSVTDKVPELAEGAAVSVAGSVSTSGAPAQAASIIGKAAVLVSQNSHTSLK